MFAAIIHRSVSRVGTEVQTLLIAFPSQKNNMVIKFYFLILVFTTNIVIRLSKNKISIG